MSQPWNFLPCKPPRKDVPVLVVKGVGKQSYVREAVYKGNGYWAGFGNAPVRAWQPIPHTPISIAMERVLNERVAILDTFPKDRTSKQHKRLLQLDVKIELAQRARESEWERYIREAATALKIVGGMQV